MFSRDFIKKNKRAKNCTLVLFFVFDMPEKYFAMNKQTILIKTIYLSQ